MLLVALMTGCSTPRALMPMPTLYATGKAELFESLPPELAGNRVNLLYVTDRTACRDKQGRLMYSAGRSRSLAFGSALFTIGMPDQKPEARPVVRLESLSEHARFPPTPYPLTYNDGRYEVDSKITAQENRVDRALTHEINRRLAIGPRKEIFLFIHGVDNSLEFALETWAGMWHFLGREGVPVVYSWPSGVGSVPITAYNYDRESGEFTIYHLKQFLKIIAANDQVERIHIVAHSRGTDVITSAIRELFIAARAAGQDMRQEYKIADLVLIAPDLDMDVVGQRLAAEKLAEGIGRITIYVSPEDKALGLASVLFSSVLRFGQIRSEDIQTQIRIGEHINNIAFIDAGQTEGIGHGYFYNNPAVSSDLMLLLRYGLAAGSPGRPLIPSRSHFWRVPVDYLKQ